MPFSASIFDILVGYTCLQGLFFSAVPFFQKRGQLHYKIIIGALLLLLGFNLAGYLLEKNDLVEINLAFFLLIKATLFSFGPLLYHYIQLRVAPSEGFKKRLLLQLIPAIFIVSISMFLAITNSSNWIIIHFLRDHQKLTLGLFSLSFFHFFFFCYQSFRFLRKQSRRPYSNRQAKEALNFIWMRRFLLLFAVLNFTVGLLYLLIFTELYYGYNAGMEYAILLFDTLCIQAIALHALWFPEGLYGYESFHVKKAKSIHQNMPTHLKQHPIEIFMLSEKPYRKNNLNLKELALQLDLSPHQLSRQLNAEFGMSFFDFVNYHRIMDAKEKLVSEEEKSILSIAYEVGFNSKTAFNRAFRKFAQSAPREFREKYFEEKRSTL